MNVPAEDFLPQIVTVRTVTMHDLAEHPPAHKRRGQQFKAVIAAVFQHHNRGARLLIGIDQFPALFKRISAADLDRRHLPRPHTLDRLPNMYLPGGADEHEIDRRISQQFPIVFISARRRRTLLFDDPDRRTAAILIGVAHRDNLRRINREERSQEHAAPLSESYHADSDFIHCFDLPYFCAIAVFNFSSNASKSLSAWV